VYSGIGTDGAVHATPDKGSPETSQPSLPANPYHADSQQSGFFPSPTTRVYHYRTALEEVRLWERLKAMRYRSTCTRYKDTARFMHYPITQCISSLCSQCSSSSPQTCPTTTSSRDGVQTRSILTNHVVQQWTNLEARSSAFFLRSSADLN
jgi:hypothetical protein